jgi:hypothetical protein
MLSKAQGGYVHKHIRTLNLVAAAYIIYYILASFKFGARTLRGWHRCAALYVGMVKTTRSCALCIDLIL